MMHELTKKIMSDKNCLADLATFSYPKALDCVIRTYLDDFMEFLPSEDEIENIVLNMYEDDDIVHTEIGYKYIAKAIAKRIGK